MDSETRELLKTLKKDAQMALDGRWDKNNGGFEAQIHLIDKHLKKADDTVCIVWCLDDVMAQAKETGVELSNAQGLRVLEYMRAKHDCNIGINWDVIDVWIEYVIQEDA